MKRYFVTFDEQDGEELDWNEISSVVEENFNGKMTKGEQQDIKDEIYELEVGDNYKYYNFYKGSTELEVNRIA